MRGHLDVHQNKELQKSDAGAYEADALALVVVEDHVAALDADQAFRAKRHGSHTVAPSLQLHTEKQILRNE